MGYQGADEFSRCITPHKKPKRGVLSRECVKLNKRHSSDRILVENYFGRMGNNGQSYLVSMCGQKVRTTPSLLLELHLPTSMSLCTNSETTKQSGLIVTEIAWILWEMRRRERGLSSNRSIAWRHSASWKYATEERKLRKRAMKNDVYSVVLSTMKRTSNYVLLRDFTNFSMLLCSGTCQFE